MIRFTLLVMMAGFSACGSNEPVSEEIPAEVRTMADSTVKIMNENLSHHEKEADSLKIDTFKTQ
jgi:ABC-type glycerol-3-phosphate transport system substrate-binding protein